MPIANTQDAKEVENDLQTIFDASSVNERLRAIRTLLVETLDYEGEDRPVSLETGPESPVRGD